MTSMTQKSSIVQCVGLLLLWTTLTMSDWLFLGQPVDEPPLNAVGFIYRIERLDTGRKYIGKKLLQFKRTKQVKGVKKKMMVTSDWKTYYGSNHELIDEVASLGEDKFKREIIKFCYQKQECNYEETRYIMEERALFSDDYYNHWCTMKVTKAHIMSALKKNLF